MMTITLYELVGDNSDKKFSPHCWKSHLALLHKGINFQSCPMRFTEKDKIAFSNQAFVPVLTDGEEAVADSWDIACYLEEKYSDQPSLFNDEAGRALAASINEWCDNSLASHIVPMVILDVYRVISEEDKVYFREGREKKLGATLEEVAARKPAAIEGFRSELDKVRELLSMQPYLGGDKPSYADICLLGMFMWIATLNDDAFLDKQDSVYAWYLRVLEHYPTAKKAINV